jgi:DNA replication protein DnaC
MPCNKLKLSHSNDWHRERSCLFMKTSRFQNVFLKGGNRPYCEDWNHADTVDMEVMDTCNRKPIDKPYCN